MIKKIFILVSLSVFVLTAHSQSFQKGTLSIIRIGSGENPLSLRSSPVFVDEYTTTGELVRSIALPTSSNGQNKSLTLSGSLLDEGFAGLSPDKKTLALVGYDAFSGLDSVFKKPSSQVARTIALISADGTVNTTTSIKDAFGKVQMRSAVANGNDIWVTGGGNGIRHTTFGSQTSNVVTNVTGKVLSIFNDQLYASSIAPNVRMAKVGSNLPVTSTSLENLPGFPVDGSACQFYLLDQDQSVSGLDVLYIADNVKGLCKYSLVSGMWVFNGSIGSRFFGLTALVTTEGVSLYATQNESSVSRIITVTDNSGYNGKFSGRIKVLAKAAENTSFRGVTFSPSK
jgi:hypothetical protein